jgi:hypothetical protein
MKWALKKCFLVARNKSLAIISVMPLENSIEFEYCEILEGTIRMIDHNGIEQTVTKGDRFVIEAGYQGSWEVLVYAKKVYVIFEPKQS